MNDQENMEEVERWELRHYRTPEPRRHDDGKQIDMIFRFGVQSSSGVMKMARFEHDIEVGGAPLIVRVSASKGGSRVEVPLRVTNVTFDPEGNVTGELRDDGTTIEFTATGEGDTEATIEAEYQGSRPGTLTATLTLHGIAGPEDVPDALELDFGDAPEEPAPAAAPGPAPEGPAPTPEPPPPSAVGAARQPGFSQRPPGPGAAPTFAPPPPPRPGK
jgi:hypothetical protein